MNELETFIEQNFEVLLFLVIWSLIWKGFALWQAARRQEKWWFIPILILNTLGILEILYLFIFIKIIDDKKPKQSNKE